MKRLITPALAALTAISFAHAPSDRAELESVYKAMSRAFASKDIKVYCSFWTPAIRWFPPKSTSATILTRDRAELLRDLRVEFANKDKVSEDFAMVHFEADKERATIDLAVSVSHLGPSTKSRIVQSERHHWLKAGGRWWLSRIEAL